MCRDLMNIPINYADEEDISPVRYQSAHGLIIDSESALLEKRSLGRGLRARKADTLYEDGILGGTRTIQYHICTNKFLKY